MQEAVEGTFYKLTVVADAAQGSVEGNNIQYAEGATATLTATANEGYKFLNWTVGEETLTDNPLTLTITSDLTVTANFEALKAYTVTATANDATLGTVTVNGTAAFVGHADGGEEGAAVAASVFGSEGQAGFLEHFPGAGGQQIFAGLHQTCGELIDIVPQGIAVLPDTGLVNQPMILSAM